MSEYDSLKCLMKFPYRPGELRKTTTSSHTLKRSKEDQTGVEVNLNWRWWGLSIAWGDIFLVMSQQPAWFVAAQVGPVVINKTWFKANRSSV